MLVVEGGERLGLYGLPERLGALEYRPCVNQPSRSGLWSASHTSARRVLERQASDSGPRAAEDQPGAMRPIPPSKSVPDLLRGTSWARSSKLAGSCRRVKGDASRAHQNRPFGRCRVLRRAVWRTVPNSLERYGPYHRRERTRLVSRRTVGPKHQLGWFCRRVKGETSRRRGVLPRPGAVAPLRTCLKILKSLKIPGGGLVTLVHPCRGPPGLIPSGQLIAR
ncbi:hypothetical protein FB451DRAFT_1511389 [Mycena latifolia]|nr:hypothetical protein FB451DRAFT_1511389 [Mycena latifolia]